MGKNIFLNKNERHKTSFQSEILHNFAMKTPFFTFVTFFQESLTLYSAKTKWY